MKSNSLGTEFIQNLLIDRLEGIIDIAESRREECKVDWIRLIQVAS
jgi:hypothetical protein